MNPKVHYRVHDSLPLELIRNRRINSLTFSLRQVYPIHCNENFITKKQYYQFKEHSHIAKYPMMEGILWGTKTARKEETTNLGNSNAGRVTVNSEYMSTLKF